ncbi:hypothetical protein N658DRAFT_490592 [Parathielavia hyrcaniae]|uniref:Extracellular membrane protein CFEM domain-containing protein n=1 Tax=Parathielavia hyrcaniae TaxID=113614 RepID=A0AAN6Q980_9PEZI|nr:hypothetical protein N658DRAFT_490592 [Parathielavia hyrcaniae]
MLFSRHMRLALTGTALLLFSSQAQASFDFPPCVDNCIESSGAEPDSAKSLCKGARNMLLDSVISCLFFSCKSDLRNYDSAFLNPIAEACEDSDREIPKSKLRAAESTAISYISMLPASTTAKTTTAAQPTTTPAPPKTTTITSNEAAVSSSSSPSTTTEDEDSAPSSTSSTSASDEEADQPTSAAGKTTTTQVALPTSATTRNSAAASPSSSASDDSGSGFDTNPFGSSTSAGPPAIRPLLYLLGLPLAAVSLLALR